MGEYSRTFEIIEQLENEKQRLHSLLEEIHERLAEVEIELGECRGYIKELEYLDGEEY